MRKSKAYYESIRDSVRTLYWYTGCCANRIANRHGISIAKVYDLAGPRPKPYEEGVPPKTDYRRGV